LLVLALAAFAFPAGSRAEIKLPSLISDHMVLQQEAKANVWGTADPGEQITVKLGGASVSAKANYKGSWNVRLSGFKPGVIGDMTITGKNTITVKDVAVGEVWVCSGQSNMEWSVRASKDADAEIAAATEAAIRLFTVLKMPKLEPTEECTGKWEICSPESIPNFSAVAYFFGRDLQQKLQVPVGLIHSSWGGTPAQFWTPAEVMAGDPLLKVYVEKWEETKAKYPAAKAEYDKNLEAWKAASELAKAEGKPIPRQPSPPRGGDPFGAPGCLWNGMIVPLLPYTIQGAIWYQGESNASDARLYRVLFPTMITSWRRAWAKGGLGQSENPEFPFLFVQLANFMARHEQPTESGWAELREAQLMTLELPRTAMAVAIDIGDEKDIHPRNKQEVGRRLALAAEAMVYYIDTEFSGPIYTGAQTEEGRIRLSFRNASGMKAANGEKIKGFEIAGADRKFVWAEAEVDGDHVLVSAPQIKAPAAVRYAWADNPEANLVNTAGLPASPFRTDDWVAAPPPPVRPPAATPAP
jgi:sialate O-acetylesterase